MAKQQPQFKINPTCFDFLDQLKQNNNRDWFLAHKDDFEREQAAIAGFADAILTMLNTHDVIETASGKKSLRRIYRDVRFSTNKAPYKSSWSGHFTRAGKNRRGGYYFRIAPGNSVIVGGFQGPNAADLKLIRDDIAFDDAPIRKILTDKTFKHIFGSLQGEQLKTSPKGYASDHSAVDLLRYKQLMLVRCFTDEEVLSPGFLTEVDNTYKAMRPFLDYMTEVLTTDVNGITL